jgi:hypothetical protein
MAEGKAARRASEGTVIIEYGSLLSMDDTGDVDSPSLALRAAVPSV